MRTYTSPSDFSGSDTRSRWSSVRNCKQFVAMVQTCELHINLANNAYVLPFTPLQKEKDRSWQVTTQPHHCTTGAKIWDFGSPVPVSNTLLMSYVDRTRLWSSCNDIQTVQNGSYFRKWHFLKFYFNKSRFHLNIEHNTYSMIRTIVCIIKLIMYIYFLSAYTFRIRWL